MVKLEVVAMQPDVGVPGPEEEGGGDQCDVHQPHAGVWHWNCSAARAHGTSLPHSHPSFHHCGAARSSVAHPANL